MDCGLFCINSACRRAAGRSPGGGRHSAADKTVAPQEKKGLCYL